jgi:hypothetical protein
MIIAESSSTDLDVESANGIPVVFINASAKPISSLQLGSDA